MSECGHPPAKHSNFTKKGSWLMRLNQSPRKKSACTNHSSFQVDVSSTLWWTYKKQWKMAIEIVDVPIKNSDFPWHYVSSPEGQTFMNHNNHIQENSEKATTCWNQWTKTTKKQSKTPKKPEQTQFRTPGCHPKPAPKVRGIQSRR